MIQKKSLFVVILTLVVLLVILIFFLVCDKKNSMLPIFHKKNSMLPIFQLNLSTKVIKTKVNPMIIGGTELEKISEFICKYDTEKTQLITIDFKAKTPSELHSLFNKFVANPHGGRCPNLQRFGGEFHEDCHYWDGHKYICMTELMGDVENGSCLIYSFGVDNDWSFEKVMDDFGCRVLMFDPTVNHPAKLGKKLSFEKIGLSAKRDDEKSYDTLSSIFKSHGHTDTKITYLKVDIEGSEVDGLLEWIQSGALKNVQQLGLEFHLLDTESTLTFFYGLVQLYIETDFRLISFDINGCVGKDGPSYTKFAEIVLMKQSKSSPCVENFVFE